jgi:hypothetical protein
MRGLAVAILPRAMNRVRAALAAIAWLLAANAARADDGKRTTPDYDGRPSPPPTPGEIALWVPRVVLFPVYLVTEYLIRRPLGALITAAERGNWATTLMDIFTFGPEHKAGIVPTAFFDFGLQPSVGLYFFWNDAFVKNHDLRLHGSYFGSDWFALSASDRWHVGAHSRLSLDANWVHRPDYVYFGEGARSLQHDESRFTMETLDVGPSADLMLGHGLLYRAKVGARTATFRDSRWGNDPAVSDQARAGVFALPASYGPGYTDLYERATLSFDSRPDLPGPQTGFRAVVHAEHGSDVSHVQGSSWIKYGASVGGAVDLWRDRVVSLSVAGELADPIRGGAIPFTEEAVWGGVEPLSGFLPGRLHGRSAAAATLAYTWPIWVWLEGRMSVAVGNAFDTGFRDFDTKLLRLSSGIGIQSTGSPDHRLEVLVGMGTETFDQGAKVDSFRLAIGGTNGF